MITYQLNKICGPIKPMNAVNNGPLRRKYQDQKRSNFEAFKKLDIGYVRTHDSSMESVYGGEHTVDVVSIFPNFDADEYDSSSYDFTLTDFYLTTIQEAGSSVFYRLGNKIEHWIKKYGTLPPKDFQKWAVICEHIIRHYNEGWADGFHMNIEYWEIWNEPNLDSDDSLHKRTWGGTWRQFLEFYAVAARHLKSCFPNLKIGGPAMADGDQEGPIREFLMYLKENQLPLDFFSWHIYCNDPKRFAELAVNNRRLLDEYGFEKTENILNEWNYVKGWVDEFVYSIEQIIGIKGAAFAASSMCLCQKAPLDMLMYYDARPCAFNGLFDFYTYRPLKTYYSFAFFKELQNIGTEVYSTDEEDVNTLAAFDGQRFASILVYFEEDDTKKESKQVEINVEGGAMEYLNCRVIDEKNNGEESNTLVLKNGRVSLEIKPNSVYLLYSK